METLKGMGFTDTTFQHFYGLYRAAGQDLPQMFLHNPDSGVPPPPPPPPLPAVKTTALHSLPNGNAPGRKPCNITPQSGSILSSAGQGFKPSPASSASASDQGASGLSCGPALAI